MARKQDAGERKAVVEPEDAPLVRGGGTDLDNAGDRDEVEPAARPGKRVKPEQQRKPELNSEQRQNSKLESGTRN